MSINIATTEYVEKKLSAFTPGPSIKEITSADGSITVTPVADGTVDLHADGGYANISEYGKSITIGRDYGVTTTIGMLDTVSNNNNCYVYGDTIKFDSYEEVIIGAPKITLENFFALSTSVFVKGPVYFNDKIIDKNGQEITGGGGGSASLPHIKDEVGNTVFISGPAVIGTDYGPESPALIFGSSTGSGDYLDGNKGQIGIYADRGGVNYFGMSTPGFYGSGGASIYVQDYMGIAYIGLKIDGQDCQLSKDDLRKLREILDAHS